MKQYESKITHRSDSCDKLLEIIMKSTLTPGDVAVLRYGHMFGCDTRKIEDKLHRVYMLFIDWKEYWEDV